MQVHILYSEKSFDSLCLLAISRYRVWHCSGNMLQQVMVDKEKELWEALWQPAAEGVYPVPVISASSRSAAAAAAQPQPERKYPTLLTLFIHTSLDMLFIN